MNAPLVSVLMTSYNREKYIAEAIESVLASTYNNFELIIVDDGSKDSTVEIAKKYAQKDSRVLVHINEKNLGDYPNRNKAASHAKGKYLKYVDADDLIYPWGLELLVSMMEQFPDAGFGLCSLAQDDNRIFPFQLSPKEAYLYHYTGPGLFHKAPLSSIIRRDVFYEAGQFAPIRMAGDFEMWHRLSQKYFVVLMPQGIVWYRKHGEQEMNSFKKYIQTYEEVKVKYLTSASCPLDQEIRSSLVRKQNTSSIKKIAKKLLGR
ncbi:glycosyltransferase family 2 protein [Pinibacter aurantiacus]|uniref:Glycosyltransferase n=1 Tax=Pinibacter aurantiacus TaxID=2851599 RepID=A0A9E2W4S8_9BACT|nr:glycosyltransferase family 2 protein [Pinibacter aurantiacus]MBV4357843.1 glycosyltransferase [Pinibacter aurantiacus]